MRNAKIAIEYFTKILHGKSVGALCYRTEGGHEGQSVTPNFQDESLAYFWTQARVAHPGGAYPAPCTDADELFRAGVMSYPRWCWDKGAYPQSVRIESAAFADKAARSGLAHLTDDAAMAHARVMYAPPRSR